MIICIFTCMIICIYIYTWIILSCTIKSTEILGRFGFLPVLFILGCFGRSPLFLPGLHFFCPVLFRSYVHIWHFSWFATIVSYKDTSSSELSWLKKVVGGMIGTIGYNGLWNPRLASTPSLSQPECFHAFCAGHSFHLWLGWLLVLLAAILALVFRNAAWYMNEIILYFRPRANWVDGVLLTITQTQHNVHSQMKFGSKAVQLDVLLVAHRSDSGKCLLSLHAYFKVQSWISGS